MHHLNSVKEVSDNPILNYLTSNDKAPPEIFIEILINLDYKSIQQTCMVNHYWNKESILASKLKLCDRIQFIFKDVDRTIDRDSRLCKNFLVINIFDQIRKSENLKQIKLIRDRDETFINIFKTLDINDLNLLSSHWKKVGFEGLTKMCQTAKLYKKLDEKNLIKNQRQKSLALQIISKDLAQLGAFCKAVEVVNTIPDQKIQHKTLKILLAKGNKQLKKAELTNAELRKEFADLTSLKEPIQYL